MQNTHCWRHTFLLGTATFHFIPNPSHRQGKSKFPFPSLKEERSNLWVDDRIISLPFSLKPTFFQNPLEIFKGSKDAGRFTPSEVSFKALTQNLVYKVGVRMKWRINLSEKIISSVYQFINFERNSCLLQNLTKGSCCK